MPKIIPTPNFVIARNSPTPSIEVDNDTIEGKYASGMWEDLIPAFTAKWVTKKRFAKTATIWMWGSQSVNFHHVGFSVWIAQYGLPTTYLVDLERYLRLELGDKVRLSDYVQPNVERDGWRSRIHVQDKATWIPLDAAEWAMYEP